MEKLQCDKQNVLLILQSIVNCKLRDVLRITLDLVEFLLNSI